MSMISSQCDELRIAADALEDEGVMPACVKLLRRAADVIWDLRCRLIYQREEVERLKREKACLRSCLSDDAENARLVMGENAKLRELCGDLFDRLRDEDEHCGECRSQCEHDAWNFGDPKCVYAKRMCELGVPH